VIAGKRVLAVISARGGSKGVPRKNIREVGGKPLIAWSIEEAKKSRYIDKLILSSEDEEIIQVAQEWGCDVPFVRPVELAQDNTPGVEPVLHAVKELPGFDYVVLLQPTSPLRAFSDIDKCLETCLRMNSPACVSVTVPDKSPYWMYTLRDSKLSPLLNANICEFRQELPIVHVLNGAVYIAKVSWFVENRTFLHEKTVACEMPKIRSIDIDDDLDLEFFRFLITRGVLKKILNYSSR